MLSDVWSTRPQSPLRPARSRPFSARGLRGRQSWWNLRSSRASSVCPSGTSDHRIELDPSFEFPLERLHFLVWANNYDGRNGELVWWHGRKAARSPGIIERSEEDVTRGSWAVLLCGWRAGRPATHFP